MESFGRLVSVLWVIALGACVLGLQRPPPRYSQQYMPETSFTCRNKIVGSYYADPETDCQVFHVCVSVAGTVQDYKFLCPNDTAFDQESQTCADWYDVDCEAATLYYASDNFDLYRIGSGLESLHYDSIRSDAEPQDHLQRSESSDPVRSSANTLNRVSSSNSYSGSKDLRGSSSGNFYNNRNGKDEDYETEKTYKEEFVQEKKKSGVRKSSRKQQFNYSSNDYNAPVSSTSAPAAPAANQNTYTGFYSGNNYNQRNGFVSSTSTARPQENFNRNPNGNRYNTPSSTYRPSTNYQNNYNNYQSVSTTSKTTVYNAYNNGNNYNQQNNGFSQSSSTLKPTTYKSYNQNYNNNNGQFVQSTTLQPSTNYQPNDYTNFQRNYNNIQRGSVPYQSTTASSIVYDDNYNSNNNNNNNNNNNGQYRTTGGTTRQDISQATTKYYPSFASSSYAPTTYSPPTKKYVGNDNTQAQTGQYYEKSSQPVKSSSQYYDSTKAPKKATQFNNYDSKYYTESSTGNYDLARSSVGIGFSPASINHLAESPRSTTPVPRKISTATTYNPNTFYSNSQRQQSPTTPKASTYVSGSARPFSSTTRLPTTTTPKPKSGKKNDYDYAYYDNTAGLEYDSLDLEHVTGNKESTKIARN